MPQGRAISGLSRETVSCTLRVEGMDEKVSRYEINRKVKMILVRHAVDLSQLQYSSSGPTVYLFGKLQKEPKGEFKIQEIEAMAHEIGSVPHVQGLEFDLSNWNAIFEPGFVNVTKKR